MRWAILVGAGLLTLGCGPGRFYPDLAIDGDGDGVLPQDGDCDDAEPLAFPGAEEVCDGIDNDCDGLVDGADPALADGDSDGFDACADCDDSASDVGPGLPEACDGIDNNCDGLLPPSEADGDGDGVMSCAGDCDDDEPNASPGAQEACDGIDNDCDGFVDEPRPEALALRVAVAGPGADLRVWELQDGALVSPSSLGVPVSPGVLGPSLAVDLDGDGAREWLRQQVDPLDSGRDEVLSLGRDCSGEWLTPLLEEVPLGGVARMVAGGDLDGDGLGDLLTVTLDGVNVGVVGSYLGRGEGTFVSRPSQVRIDAIVDGGRWAVAPTLTDLNGDGRADLLICAEEPGGTRCRRWSGLGNGSFAGGLAELSPGMRLDSVDLADADGDERADLFFGLSEDGGEGSGGLWLARGDGLGHFSEPELLLDVAAGAGEGRGALRVSAVASPATIALLWDPGVASNQRSLAVARHDGEGWTLGPVTSFSAAASASGGPEPLLISP